jgi:pantoate kinase
MKFRAYTPSNITGFFEVVEDKDPLRMGSRGCGLALEKGVNTEVSFADEFIVEMNGVREEAPTTASVLRRLAKKPVLVQSNFDVPIGCGFGASGAGALSTAIALDEMFVLVMSARELVTVAHLAEVENRTGLGSVMSMYHGGLVVRKEPGIFGLEDVIKIPCKDIEISWVSIGKISTKSVLEDKKIKKKINAAGRKAMKDFLRDPTFENFMQVSRRFAYETELMSGKVKDAIEAVEAQGGFASMAMLGDTVFSFGGGEALAEFGKVGKSKIWNRGMR